MISSSHFVRAIVGLEAATAAEQLLLWALATALMWPLARKLTAHQRNTYEHMEDHGSTEYRWPAAAAITMAAVGGTAVAVVPPLLYLVPVAMGARMAASLVVRRLRERVRRHRRK